MKKKIFAILLLSTLLLSACSSQDDNYGEVYGDGLNDIEYVEGFEGLSEEETTKKLIEEADKMEVVPDKKQ